MNRLDEAFDSIHRQDFLPEDMREHWAEDRALPIGHGQTNSQPSTVRQMLEWLDAREGMRVLDVGSGSGWTSALLARLVGASGQVDAVELVPGLVAMGRTNCEHAGIRNVTFHLAGQELGLPDKAPFDRILVSASATSFPVGLLGQLASPGKLVVPVGHTIYEVSKDEQGTVAQVAHPGFVFVPLL